MKARHSLRGKPVYKHVLHVLMCFDNADILTPVGVSVFDKARDQKTQGNLQLAQECSDKAKWYNILAAGWNMLVPLLAVVLLVLLLVHLGSSKGSFDFLGEDGFQNFLKLFSW